MLRSALFALSLTLFGVASAKAQVWTPMPAPRIDMQNQIWRNFRMAQIGIQMAADMARSRGGKPNAGAKGATARPPAAVYQKQFAFIRVAHSPLAEKMRQGASSSADAASMQKIIDYTWSKYQISFADENRRLGMPFDDVATAMTYYIVGGYMYANDLSGVQSEHSVAVYKQVASILSREAEFGKLSAADKQMLAELLVTMGGVPVLAFEQKRDKNAQIAAGRANLERLFGPNYQRMRITENGVEF